MSDLDKIKMEVESSRFQVVQADKEISGIKLALRSLAVKASTGVEGAEELSNSIRISATKVSQLNSTQLTHLQNAALLVSFMYQYQY